MRDKDWGIPTLLLIYLVVIGLPLLALWYGVSQITVASELSNERGEQEKTILDQRIAAAREVKQALARGVPRPEPLPPVTAKAARLHASTVAAKAAETPEKEIKNKTKLSAAARNALAMGTQPERQVVGPAPVDRAGTGGW